MGQVQNREQAQKYKIPRSTIRDHVTGRRGIKSETCGRPTALPKDVEAKLAECLKCLEKWGFGLSRKEILEIVGSYVKLNKIKNVPFKNGKPGEDWFLLFKKRHNLSIKKPEAVEYARKKNTDPFIIYEYFALLKNTLEQRDLFDKPSQIWNMDETGFCSDPSRIKVVGAKGATCTRITAGTGRSNTTVLFAAAADGSKAPPLIVFKGKNVWDSWIPKEGKEYPGTTYAATSNGWMETAIFKTYFTKTFIPQLTEKRPVLLLYDGHATHIDLEVVEAAINANITILKLPPHSSHLLQPLDLSVFRSVKTKWDELLVKWQRKNVGKLLNKSTLTEFVGIVWNCIEVNVIQAGFKKGGIHPFNSNAVPADKFDPAALERFEKQFPNGFNIQELKSIELEEIHIGDPPSSTEINEEVVAIDAVIGVTDALISEVNASEILDTNTIDVEMVETISENENLPSTSTDTVPTDFQTLLLQYCKEDQKTSTKVTRKRISAGAEVITSTEVHKKLKDLKDLQTSNASRKNKKPVKGQNRVEENKENETSENHCNDSNMERKNMKKMKRGKVLSDKNISLEVTSSDSEYSVQYEEESDHLEFSDDDNQISEFTKNASEMQINDWVLVRFESQKSSIKYFIGKLETFEEETNDPIIKFVKKKQVKHDSVTEPTFIWPSVDDISVVPRDSVILILPEPDVGRRGDMKFNVGFTFSSYRLD